MTDYRTISLTNARPVSIVEANWPIVASASDHDNQYECQANRKWQLKVRQHADGRAIVYGTYTSQFPNERNARGGYQVAAGDDAALVRAINDVAGEIAAPRLASECIADLPATDVVE